VIEFENLCGLDLGRRLQIAELPIHYTTTPTGLYIDNFLDLTELFANLVENASELTELGLYGRQNSPDLTRTSLDGESCLVPAFGGSDRG
jgi:hypothetical protein